MNSNFWKIFAKLTEGEIKEGRFDASETVVVTEKDWKISFDHFTLWSGKYGTRLTRVTIPFISNDNFRFEIFEKNIFYTIAKVFGFQDIQIGDKEFDFRFNIKSNNEIKIKAILENADLRTLITKLNKFNIQTSDQKGIWEEKLPENELELSVYFNDEIFDTETLLITKNLIIDIINTMSKNNSAQPKKANS